MPSDFTATETIDGKEYQFELLDLADALEVESQCTAIIAQTMGKGEKDHSLLYKIGKKVCVNLCEDSFEIKDIDKHFKGKALLFNKVIVKGVKVNFPDFFTMIEENEGSAMVAAALDKSGLGSVI